MSNASQDKNFLEYLKKQKWLVPVLIVVFLIMLGSMLFLSEDFAIAPFIYQKF